MNADETLSFIARYGALPDEGKIACLAHLSHELTIVFRGWLLEGATATQLSPLNELQHQISSMIRHLSLREPKRYPDDVFIRILFERAPAEVVKTRLEKALGSLKRVAE